jgi:unsaturated rhamnogalacturonyl hydrolase
MTTIPSLTPLELAGAAARNVVSHHPPAAYACDHRSALMLLALWKLAYRLGDTALGMYIKTCVDTFVTSEGNIAGYNKATVDLDQIGAGRILLELHAAGEGSRYLNAARKLRAQLANQPRTSTGGFWHGRHHPYQIWLDGFHMHGPFAIRWGLDHADDDLVDDVCDQLVLAAEKTRDPLTGLLRHGWDERRKQLWSDPVSGRSPHVLGRAMGWFAMALVDMLEIVPEQHPKHTSLLNLFRHQSRVIITARDNASALWPHVLDQRDRPGNNPEASASAMLCYSLAKGVRLGLLEPGHGDVAWTAFESLVARHVTILADGSASLSGIRAPAGLAGEMYRDGSYAHYMAEPVVSDDFNGVGPLILACIELSAIKGPSKSS